MNKSLQSRIGGEDSSFAFNNSSYATEVRHFFKVILLGDIAVGKTSIAKQFANKKFSDEYQCTMTPDFISKTVNIDDENVVEMNIWDTCGQERFRTITRQFYKDSRGCVLVFDVTNQKSFEDLENWIEDLQAYGEEDLTTIIVGNKSDLSVCRVVSFEQASKFARKFEYDYIEVSAKKAVNVSFLLEILCKSMISKYEDRELQTKKKLTNRSGHLDSALRYTHKPKKRKTDCC